jgi:mono/diheme cytochrome c family protein
VRNRGPMWALLAPVLLSLAACSDLPGRPAANSVPVDPDSVTDFKTLFKQNCAGCHGEEAKGGAALAIGDPVYLAIVDDDTLHKIVTHGIAGTSMPAFAKSAGGMLTADQVDAIIRGIRQAYSQPNAVAGVIPPPYATSQPGNATRGAAVYQTFCASCHGPEGEGGPKASSIVNGSFLALLTDQELRSLVIVGRPDLGAPDWRNNVPGKPMSPEEISDVVAWLSAQRPPFPGRPYPHTANALGEHP